jgi:hypothetical protein
MLHLRTRSSKRIVSDWVSAILLFLTTTNTDILILTVEQYQGIRWFVPNENWASFKKIANSLHTTSIDLQENKCSSVYGPAFASIGQKCVITAHLFFGKESQMNLLI